MPWKELSIMEQRLEFVTLATAQGANVAELCRRFGVSRETGHKWITRFRTGGTSGLESLSRRPKASPERTSDAMENAVLALRDKHPVWGGRKLRRRLTELGHKDVPSASTITQILHRHGRIAEAESIRRTAMVRFEREHPNELWQMDFKGHVPMHVGGRCHPLTVLDDCSRFAIGLRACENEQMPTVREHLISLFRTYGLPQRILCDNGPPWGTTQGLGRHSKLTAWLLRLGVVTSHGRPWHPQTQGKDERFHRTLKAELLSRQELLSVSHAQQEFDRWRDVYNLERPNEAIGLDVPVQRYKPSERAYPEKLPELEFSPLDEVRWVNRHGQIKYKGRILPIGSGFARERVGVRIAADGLLEVRYGPHVVERVDLAGKPPEL